MSFAARNPDSNKTSAFPHHLQSEPARVYLPSNALLADLPLRIPSSANRKLSLRTPHPTERESSSGLLPTNLPLFPGDLQLPVPFRVDLLLPPRQHVLRRDVANGAIQTNIVVRRWLDSAGWWKDRR